MFCLFLSFLHSLVTWKELCEQTTRLHTSPVINGSRISYITVKRFAFLSVETILARTIRNSNKILNWFWIILKSVNPSAKPQENGTRLVFERNIAHLAHCRALRTLMIASAERLENLFVQAKFTRTLCIWIIHVPNENSSAFVSHTFRVNAVHIVIALNYFTLVCNVV